VESLGQHLTRGLNIPPSIYITIHQQERSRMKIRNVYRSICGQYYIDVFLI
jgi:hypothetical protein